MAHQDVISTSPERAAPDPLSRRRGRRKRNLREYGLFALLILPNITLVLTFEYWPVLYNAWLSLTRWNMISGSPVWVGLQNYIDLFTSPGFHTVLLNTLVFGGFVVIGSVTIGLALAVLINQKLRLRGIVRTAAFAPYVISGAAVATLWLFIFDPNYGLSRVIFSWFGASSPSWTTSAEWAMPALIIAYLWKGCGFVAIIPSSSPTILAVYWLSPEAIITSRPKFFISLIAWLDVSLIGSITATIPITSLSKAIYIGVLASLANCLTCASNELGTSLRESINFLFPIAISLPAMSALIPRAVMLSK